MVRLLAAAILICASVLGFAPGADAGWYGTHRGRGHYQHYQPDAILPGFLGGIVGGMVGDWLRSPEPPPVIVVAPPPAPSPWTAEWYEYCDGKYRSFDARTGFYVGYDGIRHFCR
jgi:hypothetical protein